MSAILELLISQSWFSAGNSFGMRNRIRNNCDQVFSDRRPLSAGSRTAPFASAVFSAVRGSCGASVFFPKRNSFEIVGSRFAAARFEFELLCK